MAARRLGGSGAVLDAVVVGAGPAGAVAALELARAGRSVALVERAAPPRYKTCGGGLVLRARRMLEQDLGVALDGVLEREPPAAVLGALDLDLCFRVERDPPLVAMAMRATLDARLVAAAVAAGAELRTPCRFERLEQQPDVVELATDRGPLRARWLLACDGATSRVARAAGWPENPRAIPAVESELQVDPATFARFSDAARFDFGVLPHGYAWVFPKRAHLSVGCLSTRRGASGLKAALERYLERLGIAPRGREDHGFVIPAAPRPGPAARGRVLLVGDAAGLADPITLEGISHAIASARLAARAVAARPHDAPAVRALYLRTLRREVLGELALARRLAPVLYGSEAARRALFRRAGPGLARAMARAVAGERGYRRLLFDPRNPLRLARALLARDR